MSVREADMLSALPIPKRQKSEPDKHLFMCIMPIGVPPNPMWYAVKSVPLSSLSGGSSSEHDIQLQDVVVWSDTTLPYAMGFIRAGDLLYGIGGAIYDKELSYFTNQDFLVRELRFAHLPLGGKSYLHTKTTSSMKWGKCFPIVVEIGDLIYVLSQPPAAGFELADTIFEVYDPSKDEWTSLDRPPFLDSRISFRLSCSYVVIGNKLCVSSEGGSCTFDTETRTWGPCNLFLDYYNSDDMSSEEIYSRMEDVCYNEQLSGVIGPPFPFVQNAIFYENFLLCNVPFLDPPVIAFEILNGKVVRKLTLLDNSIQPGPCTDFVDLGGGEFCLLSQGNKWDLCNGEVRVVKFKVWKGEDGRLGCADVMKSTLKFSAPELCQAICFFTL